MGKRFLTLDAMRGVAAIVVVVYHSAIITNGACTDATCNVRFGYLAVDTFFALSGYVLSHSYDPQFAGGMRPWAFMKQRVIRLAPIYWLALLIGLPLAGIDVVKGEMSGSTLIGATFLNAAVLPAYGNAAHPYSLALLRPAWSLFFELWVANLVFALFWRQLRGINLVMLIGGSLAGLMIGTRWYGNLDMGPVWATFAGGFPRVLFSFFLGVALRRASGRIHLPAVPSPLILGAMLTTFFLPVSGAWQHVFELGCVMIVYPALILAGAATTERYPRPAVWLGNASYALYLLHMPMLDFWGKGMHRLGLAPHPLAAMLFVATALSAALLVDRHYDRRARRGLAALLDRPSQRRPRPGIASASPALVAATAGATLP